MANRSASSFIGSPAWPFTQLKVTWPCAATSSTNGFHRSWLATGSFLEFFQPRRSQPSIHPSLNADTTYLESDTTSTGPGCAATA